MKGLFSFSVTSTFTFILSILAILVIAVSAPGVVQAVLGPAMAPTSPAGSAIQESLYYGPVVNPAANFGSLTDNGTAAYMGIGTNTPVSPLHIYSTTSTQPETIDLDGTQPITAQWNNYSNSGGSFSGSGFLARFARNTRALPANVQAGDRLGFNVFGGWAGAGFKHTGAIEAIVGTGTISDTSLPTYMKFSTTPDGSASRLERMRITSYGNVGIGTTDPSNGKLVVTTAAGEAVLGHSDSGIGVHGEQLANGNYGYLGAGNYGVYGRSENQTGVKGESINGTGVIGVSTNGRGVYASSTSDFGVEGLSTSGSGVGGYSTSGRGVYAESTSGPGVQGNSTSGNGVWAYSANSAAVYGLNGNGNYGYLGDNNTGVYGYSASSSGKAGNFQGNVSVTENLTVAGKAAIGTSSQPNSVLQVAGPIATAYRLINTGGVFPATETDSVIACDATGVGMITINLPFASGKAGRAYTVKRLDVESGWVVQVNGAGSTIDGAAFYNLVGRWKYVTVVCDGANWLITANN